jgi:hypothetical protein
MKALRIISAFFLPITFGILIFILIAKGLPWMVYVVEKIPAPTANLSKSERCNL